MGILADGVKEVSTIGSTLGGLAWSNLIYWGGLFAFFGASMKIPFLIHNGEMYVYNPGQEMHDFLVFVSENQTLSTIVVALIAGWYLVYYAAQDGGPSEDAPDLTEPDIPFRELADQLALTK